MKRFLIWLSAACFMAFVLVSCSKDHEASTPEKPKKEYSTFTRSFIGMVEGNPELKNLLVESIEKCRQTNPDKESNPVQSLDEYYDLVEWSTRCMPWDIVPQPKGRNLLNRIDQCLNYFYWLVDQDLEALHGKDYYRPSLQYHEPFRSWLIDYTCKWGEFLSTPASWTPEYLSAVKSNEAFGLQNGWYESETNWKCFNDFFSRHLSSPEVRPIAGPNDASIVCSPADSEPQGIWKIDDEGQFVQDFATIKSRRYSSTEELLATSAFSSAFRGGTMMHTFLNVHDYHRYHFPVSGRILEMLDVPGDEAIGGNVEFDERTKTYILMCDIPQWQAIETRAIIVLQTEFGKVAVMPIGMSQVCSCNWADSLHIGQEVKKGDEMGYFLFGGSDIVLLFDSCIDFTPRTPRPSHLLMGEELCRIGRKK